MAAGLGTRLRPLTYEVPKPMVPVANRPVIEHLLRLLREHRLHEVIANLHWFPETIQGPLGDGSQLGVELSYHREESLTGTAGGVRAVREFLTEGGGDFLVMAGDALTDIDLTALREAHRANGGIATLAVKRVPNVSEYGVVITGSDGRVQGFQEKPDPAEALSDLASCMIYALSPRDLRPHRRRGRRRLRQRCLPGAARPRPALPRACDRRLLERRRLGRRVPAGQPRRGLRRGPRRALGGAVRGRGRSGLSGAGGSTSLTRGFRPGPRSTAGYWSGRARRSGTRCGSTARVVIGERRPDRGRRADQGIGPAAGRRRVRRRDAGRRGRREGAGG